VATSGEAPELSIITPKPPETIGERFLNFLKSYYTPEEGYKYRARIARLIAENSKSLVVDFPDLLTYDSSLAELIVEKPLEVIPVLSEALREAIKIEDSEYAQKHKKFNVRFRKLPEVVSIRRLRAHHIDKLIMVEGIVTRATPVKHQLIKAIFRCKACGTEIEVPQVAAHFVTPTKCPNEACPSRRGPFELIEEKCEYIDWQKIVIQEKPEDLPPGQLPRSLEAILIDDLVDTVKPGDRVVAIGVLRIQQESLKKSKPPVFSAYLDINYIEAQTKEFAEVEITPEDEKKILELAKDPRIKERIVKSIAPSIHGMRPIKEAIACLLFGGVPKVYPDGVRVRGDIHILLVGDPGTGKSLTYSVPVLYYEPGKGLQFRPIGEIVDTLIEQYRNRVKVEGESEILYLRDVGVEIYVPSVNPEDFTVEWKKVRAVIRHRAPEKVVLVKTKTGRTIVVTKDHSILVFNGSKLAVARAQDLIPGKSIVPVLRRILPVSTEKLTNFHGMQLDWDIGYLVGMFLGDGTIAKVTSGERFELTSLDPNVLVKISEILQNKFSTICSLHIHDSRSMTYKLICQRDAVVEWLKQFIRDKHALHREKVKGYETRLKYVPYELLLNGPEEFVAGFISGLLESDGYIAIPRVKECGKSHHGEISLTLVNRELATAFSLALTRLGIWHSLRTGVKLYKGKELMVYTIRVLDISKLKSVVQLISEDKMLRLAQVAEPRTTDDIVPVPRELVREISLLGFCRGRLRSLGSEFRGKVYRGYVGRAYAHRMVQKLMERAKVTECGELSGIQKLARFLENEYLGWDLVAEVKEVSISEVEPEHSEYVYDLSVEDYENFVAGYGLIFVHNSQLLKFVARVAPRGVYTTGKGSTAAGLTAAVVRDKATGEYYLEAGALVLADGGVCCIDELEKMESRDRVAIHEAMEQQTISIAKAGIVATLNARCAILAAANPAYGRYLPNRTLAENIDLPVTILSRFDLIFIIRDEPEQSRDTALARHITMLHQGATPEEFRDIIPPDLLRKYIAYARKYVKPKLSPEAARRIEQFFLELRRQSQGPNSPIAITARQLEALIRLAEAEARMALRPVVTLEDAEAAIRLMMEFLKSAGMDLSSGTLDIDIVMAGRPRSQQEKLARLMDIIKSMEEEKGKVKVSELIKRAEEEGIDREFVEKAIETLKRQGELYEPKPGYIKRVKV